VPYDWERDGVAVGFLRLRAVLAERSAHGINQPADFGGLIDAVS